MNRLHLRAVLWLRWRILVNRTVRAGRLSNAVFTILLAFGGLLCVAGFLTAFAIGIETLPEARPFHLLAAWAALSTLFLFIWLTGLMTDLQHSEVMSLEQLLPLPVSSHGVFLYNYLSSFVSVAVAICLPAMAGLCLAMVIVHGPRMLWCIPLVLAFLGMITALTYQLRGWLAGLMQNKRRGRNVIALLTFLFVLLIQVPNLINMSELGSDRTTVEMTGIEQSSGDEERDALPLAREEHTKARLKQTITLTVQILPIGWLAFGASSVFAGHALQGVACFVGMFSIGAWSLRRSFRSTLAAALGREKPVRRRRSAAARADSSAERGERHGLQFGERRLPFVDDREAGIALASLRYLLRAPEVKLSLLSPLVILLMFGFLLSRSGRGESLGAFAPLMTLGSSLIVQLSASSMIANSFGLDRNGVRSFLLAPLPRHRILRGKNLAMAPVGIGISLTALAALWFLLPLGPFHVLGACLQAFSAYLLTCLIGNVMSILIPIRLKENTLRAENARLKPILTQLLPLVLLPVAFIPLMIPAGADFLLRLEGWQLGGLWFFLLHAIGLAGIAMLYGRAILVQGDLLQRREAGILEILTKE